MIQVRSMECVFEHDFNLLPLMFYPFPDFATSSNLECPLCCHTCLLGSSYVKKSLQLAKKCRLTAESANMSQLLSCTSVTAENARHWWLFTLSADVTAEFAVGALLVVLGLLFNDVPPLFLFHQSGYCPSIPLPFQKHLSTVCPDRPQLAFEHVKLLLF